MNKQLYHPQRKSLIDDEKTFKKIQLNHQRNIEQDNTERIDEAITNFKFEDCKNENWNPESFSLMYKTPLWDQASHSQKVKLNQLYWIAYYSQIISDKIATIFLNQTCAAGLFGLDDFRLVCDTLDLESTQERAHIQAFKKISEDFEAQVFGERLFTYPMRTPFREAMLFKDTHLFMKMCRRWQTKFYAVLSSDNPFIACQYFTVRGVRALSGNLVQHQLAQHYLKPPEQERAPIPSQISYFHFMDESFHFNSSSIIGLEVINTLKEPTLFEKTVANMTLAGCQRDHYDFSSVLRGIFWYDPALFKTVYKLLRSPVFLMSHSDAMYMMRQCFTKENEGVHLSFDTHQTALGSYREYVSDLRYISKSNREMKIMARQSLSKHMAAKRKEFERFEKRQLDLLPVITGPKTRMQPLELS